MTGFCKNFIITGTPSVGKTTLVKDAVFPYPSASCGFLTEEVKTAGAREGFLIKSLDGKKGLFASKRLASPVRLNKYGIDLKALEEIAIASMLKGLREQKIIVIDEIGAMEMFSEKFRSTTVECLSSPCPVLATIRRGSQPFTDSIARMDDTKVFTLEKDTYTHVLSVTKIWVKYWADEILNRQKY